LSPASVHDNCGDAVAKPSIKTVGMVVKRDRQEALAIAQELAGWLRANHTVALAEADIAAHIGAEAVSRDELVGRADLIVVAGGDGTLLSIARRIGARETPILGINLGGLGFLTEVTVKEARETLARVLAGNYEVDRRITLEATVEHPGAPLATAGHAVRALNDVVLNKGPLGRMMQLEVVADGKAFCTYRADGLIVATPTGSTAYALSAGGPIIYPTLGVILLAPICPHTLTNRPVVLPDNFEIEVRVRVSDHDAVLSMDGQDSRKLSQADTVRVRRGRHAVVLVRSTHAYFEIWRDKLRWG